MEPVHVKETFPLLDRVNIFAIQNKGDGSLQNAIKGIINMVENIAIRSKKQTSILIFFIVNCFLQHVYVVMKFKSSKCSYSIYISSPFLSENVYISW